VVIPVGTVLEGIGGPDGELVVTWQGHTLPMPMPIDACALDQEAALLMLKWYEHGEPYQGQGHRLGFGPGLDRDAMFAMARGRQEALRQAAMRRAPRGPSSARGRSKIQK
jgi:hypothetical protein